MGKIVILRKSGNSLILTVPKSICELYSLNDGSPLELEPFTKDTLQLKIV